MRATPPLSVQPRRGARTPSTRPPLPAPAALAGPVFPASLLLTVLASVVLASAVRTSALPAQEVDPATLVVRDAKIVTMDPRYPRAEALAVRGEWIVAVGTEDEIAAYVGPDTEILAVGGRLVIPGFNDSHAHFGGGSSLLSRLNLYGVDSREEVLALVAERVAEAEPGEWITGSRYDHTLWGAQDDWPTKEDLDRVAPENPVALRRASGHSSWVNSMALEVSGITAETPDPPAGEIQRDPGTGEPTGILLETAQGLLEISRGEELSPEERRRRRERTLLDGFEHAAKIGVTSVQTSSSLDEMAIVRELHADGWKTLRWTGWGSLGRARRYHDDGVHTGDGDHWVRFGMLKGFIDGTLGDGTAAMFEPFSDRPGFTGLPRMEQDELTERVVEADALGFQVGIHAIGDRGVHMVLNAFEQAMLENGTTGRRHRVEHAQLIAPDDIRRFGRLGVVPSMQQTHQTTDMRFAEGRIGYERSKTAYPWRSLLDAGAVLAFGTDWSVEPLDPMRGVFSSTTRMNIQEMAPEEGWFPEQKLTVWESLYYYTWGSAYGEHMEHVKGSLQPGKLADLVVMDRDLFAVPPREILEARVDYTVVGGRVVWDREEGRFGVR